MCGSCSCEKKRAAAVAAASTLAAAHMAAIPSATIPSKRSSIPPAAPSASKVDVPNTKMITHALPPLQLVC